MFWFWSFKYFLFKLPDDCVDPFGNEFANGFQCEQSNGDPEEAYQDTQHLPRGCLRSDESISCKTQISAKIKKGTFISPVGYGVLHENVNLVYSLGVLPLEGIPLNKDAEIQFVRTLEKKAITVFFFSILCYLHLF